MTLRSRFAALTGLVAAALIFTAGPASAAERPAPATAVTPAGAAGTWADTDCPDNNMCAWEHAHYGGRFIYMGTGCSNFTKCFATNFGDVASSLWNRTSYTWCFYTGTYYTWREYRVPRDAKISFLGESWNDAFLSAKKC
ncbi:MAG TPA: peptidase inhibitor family I36 protein [Pilimelia sp.]|nr:peptidase inhibitor family I36 protein [Pilimelia sp.]